MLHEAARYVINIHAEKGYYEVNSSPDTATHCNQVAAAVMAYDSRYSSLVVMTPTQ
jgi:hypothetical protein